jgi:hypothetical protein
MKIGRTLGGLVSLGMAAALSARGLGEEPGCSCTAGRNGNAGQTPVRGGEPELDG